jgi:hypothetical protein
MQFIGDALDEFTSISEEQGIILIEILLDFMRA